MNNTEKNKQVVILATAKALPGKETALEQALQDAGVATRAQQGCIRFDLFRSAQDPAVITAIEHWATSEDHQKHLQGDHVKTLMAKFEGVLAEPPAFVFLSPL